LGADYGDYLEKQADARRDDLGEFQRTAYVYHHALDNQHGVAGGLDSDTVND